MTNAEARWWNWPWVRKTEGLVGHLAAVVLGFVMMVVGLAMGVTVVMLPVGIVVGLLGVAIFVGGLFGHLNASS
jgi:hypothetical protein